MPGAGWALNRFAPTSIPGSALTPVSTPVRSFRHVIGQFTFVRLHGSHLTQSSRAFCRNAHHQGSLPQQLAVVWSLLLQADSGGPTPIFNEAPRSPFLVSFLVG